MEEVAKSMVKIGVQVYAEATQGSRGVKGHLQALLGLRMQAASVNLTGTETTTPVLNLRAQRVDVGAVSHEQTTHRLDSTASINLALTVEGRAEWRQMTSRQWEAVVYRVEFAQLGSRDDPIEEFVMHGGVFMAQMGLGRIRKLILVDEGDTASQSGVVAGGSYTLTTQAATVTAGFRAGSMQRVGQGRCYFYAPGVIVDTIERITPETYDTRIAVEMTVGLGIPSVTADGGEAHPAPLNSDAAIRGHVTLGEDRVGFEVPNAMIPGRETISLAEKMTQEARARDQAEAAEKARIQDKIDAIKADADRVTGEAITRERAAAAKAETIAAVQAALQEGKLPPALTAEETRGMSVTRAGRLTGSAMKAIQTALRNKTLTLAETREALKWLKFREALVTRHDRGNPGHDQRVAAVQKLMGQLKAYGVRVKAECLTPPATSAVATRAMPDSRGAIDALRAERTLQGMESLLHTDPRILEGIVEDARPKGLLDQAAEAYQGSLAERIIHGTAEVIGRAAKGIGLGSSTLTEFETREEWVKRSEAYDAITGPMDLLGQAAHSGVKVGYKALGASEQSAETLATATLDGLAVVSLGRMAAPKVRGVLRTTGRAVAEGTASVADLVRRFEIGVDPQVHSANGFGGIKLGLKPSVTEAATVETAAAAVSEAPVSYRFQSESGVFVETPIEWTSPVGTKQTYKVFQRTDIDWHMIRTDGPPKFIGKTNREAALAGKSPQLPDGHFVRIHHLGQDSRGGLVEASTQHHSFQTERLPNGKTSFEVLHSQHGYKKPHPEYPVNHTVWSRELEKYWQSRVGGIE